MAFQGDERGSAEIDNLVRLMALFYQLPPPPDVLGEYGSYRMLQADFRNAVQKGGPEEIEESFLSLYCLVHGNEAPYTTPERRRLDETGGYWCHAGGISPLLKAGAYISKDTVSADYGAGNGLQGLLLQKLYPHQRTIQIEISSRMVDCGRALQSWLGIPGERVDWRVSDIMDVPPLGMDFIYLYRPVKPEGRGAGFYKWFSEALKKRGRTVVLFSVADCLKDFLPGNFREVYNDGHLTCFRGLAE